MAPSPTPAPQADPTNTDATEALATAYARLLQYDKAAELLEKLTARYGTRTLALHSVRQRVGRGMGIWTRWSFLWGDGCAWQDLLRGAETCR